ncbi:MAG: hypothetical protein WDO14_06650 [Bacteroidota bacterium]
MMRIFGITGITDLGRIFFGVSIAVLGILTVVDHEFPYMLIPPEPAWRPGAAIVGYFFGALLVVSGLGIVFKWQTRAVSLITGVLLLLVFVLYYLPYQFIVTNFTTLHEWENAEKELDLACGAFVVAGIFSERDRTSRPADIVFAITIISYGIFHFQLAKEVAEYVPSWVPARLFFAYLAGAGLIASGIAIITRIKFELASFLLGMMILTWFLVLHVPRIVMSPIEDLSSEIASACLALAYSGIAFMISHPAPHLLRGNQ